MDQAEITAALNAKHDPIVRKPQAKKAVPQKVAPTDSATEKQRKARGKKDDEDQPGAATTLGICGFPNNSLQNSR